METGSLWELVPAEFHTSPFQICIEMLVLRKRSGKLHSAQDMCAAHLE